MYEHGVAMGEEFRGKGVNIALGPVMNMARAPEGGRMWEGQGKVLYLVLMTPIPIEYFVLFIKHNLLLV